MSDRDLHIPVQGMTCANCALTIERILKKKTPGVVQAEVNFATEKAHVRFDDTETDIDQIIAQIGKAGYNVATENVEFPVTGMTCANCALTIERALKKKTPGVINASVNFGTEKVNITYLPGILTRTDLVSAIERAGYGVAETD